MRVKLCARCPYTPRDLADYYDANSSSHLCFRCDSKSAPAGLAILVTTNRESKCATAENILKRRSAAKAPAFCGGKFELIPRDTRTRSPMVVSRSCREKFLAHRT